MSKEPEITLEQQRRFWDNVKYAAKDDPVCWPWQGTKNADGYGELKVGGRKMYAHKVAWLIFNGPPQPGNWVCHQCDDHSCCNPSHLYELKRDEESKERRAAHKRW